jgi:hypothetical protein
MWDIGRSRNDSSVQRRLLIVSDISSFQTLSDRFRFCPFMDRFEVIHEKTIKEGVPKMREPATIRR